MNMNNALIIFSRTYRLYESDFDSFSLHEVFLLLTAFQVKTIFLCYLKPGDKILYYFENDTFSTLSSIIFLFKINDQYHWPRSPSLQSYLKYVPRHKIA